MYAIYGNMDPINITQMLAYIPYMDPMGYVHTIFLHGYNSGSPSDHAACQVHLPTPRRHRWCPAHLPVPGGRILPSTFGENWDLIIKHVEKM